MSRKLFFCGMLFVLALVGFTMGKSAYADSFTDVPVTKLSTMSDWDRAVQVSYQREFSLSQEENPEENIYLSFTLEKAGLVRMMQSISYENTGVANVGAYSTKVYVYSDMVLANEKMEVATPSKDGWESTYQYLEAGTYYIKTTAKYSWGYSTKFTKKICIGYVEADHLLKTSVTINEEKNNAEIVVDGSAMGQAADTMQYVAGEYTMNDIRNQSVWKISQYASSGSYKATISDDTTRFSVKQNGTYTIRINVKYTSNSQDDVAVSVPVTVSGLDDIKPSIQGVKNGKKYKKAVKITFSDKDSGIKKAVLNGKKIKNGQKVKKKGSYTLKVTDKAGNVTIVKFKILK